MHPAGSRRCKVLRISSHLLMQLFGEGNAFEAVEEGKPYPYIDTACETIDLKEPKP